MKSTPPVLQYRGATYRLVEAAGSMTLYHIGPHPAKPILKQHKVWKEYDEEKGDWVRSKDPPDPTGYERSWLKERTGPVVFLSDNPAEIYLHHGIGGNLYAYKVPMSVVKESGGIHKYDSGREVIIPERLWDQVELIGKVPESKFKKLIKDYHKPYSPPREFQEKWPERDLEKEEQVLHEHSRRKKLEKGVERAKRRLNVTKVLDEGALKRQFLNSLSTVTRRFVESDFPLAKDHPWHSSIKRIFDHWVGKNSERYGLISRIKPSAPLKSVRELDPMVWDKQVQVLEPLFLD